MSGGGRRGGQPLDQCPTVARQAHLHLAGGRRGHESASQSLTRARARGAHRKTCANARGAHRSTGPWQRRAALPLLHAASLLLGRLAAQGRATSPGRAWRPSERDVSSQTKKSYNLFKRETKRTSHGVCVYYCKALDAAINKQPGTKLFTWTISGVSDGSKILFSLSSVILFNMI